jgi:transposase
MLDFRLFSQEDWDLTPPSVKAAFIEVVEKNNALEASCAKLLKEIENKDNRLNKNSNNSSKPPSSDNPFNKKTKKENKPKKKGKAGAKKGHEGHRQKLVEPNNVENVFPKQCVCGGSDFKDTEAFYTHQEYELPEIVMDVNHFILHKGQCCKCGKTNKAVVPPEHQTGYGPRLTALIGNLAGNHGCSRSSVQEFCATVLNFHICLGAIQKVVNRCSESILPHYNKIAGVVRKAMPRILTRPPIRKTAFWHGFGS